MVGLARKEKGSVMAAEPQRPRPGSVHERIKALRELQDRRKAEKEAKKPS